MITILDNHFIILQRNHQLGHNTQSPTGFNVILRRSAETMSRHLSEIVLVELHAGAGLGDPVFAALFHDIIKGTGRMKSLDTKSQGGFHLSLSHRFAHALHAGTKAKVLYRSEIGFSECGIVIVSRESGLHTFEKRD